MARISTYALDPTLEGGDRIIGSDASNANATMNFSLAGLGDFYTRTGLADATRLGYRFMVGDAVTSGAGSITFSSGSEFSNITRLNVNAVDVNGLDIGVLNGLIEGTRLKVISARPFNNQNEIGQGYYTVGTVEPLETPSGVITGYEIVLTNITASGSFRTALGELEPDNEFIIVPLPGGTGTSTGPGVNDGVVVSGGYDAATGILSLNRSEGLDPVSVTGFPTGNAAGTVTSITAGTGLDGGTITESGTISLDSTTQTTLSQVGTNTSAISTNTTAIAANASGILANDGEISTNASNIAANTLNISTNATEISTNATDILANATNIGNNAAAIALNTAKNSYPTEDAAKLGRFADPMASPTGVYNVSIDAAGDLTYVIDNIPVDATTPEQVEDIVGTMATSGTMTGITVSYTDNGDTGRGVLNFVVDGDVTPTRHFNNTLSVQPGRFQETSPAAPRTWTIAFANTSQVGFENINIITAVDDELANPGIYNTVLDTATDIITVTTTDARIASETTIHIQYSYTEEGETVVHTGNTSVVIGLQDPPPTPTEYTTFFGTYNRGDGTEEITPLPSSTTNLTEVEVQDGHRYTFPAITTPNNTGYAVVQIETQDLIDAGTTATFQEVINDQLHNVSFDGEGDTSTTARLNFTSFRFIYGPDPYTVQININ